jgi:cell division protein FtsB
MSGLEFATTKSGLIMQVRQLHDALAKMTAERDHWERQAADLQADIAELEERCHD